MGNNKAKIDIKVKPKFEEKKNKPVKAGSTHTNEKGGIFNDKAIKIRAKIVKKKKK